MEKPARIVNSYYQIQRQYVKLNSDKVTNTAGDGKFTEVRVPHAIEW